MRGIFGVDQFNQHTCDFGFVGDKLAELEERPRLVSTPLAFPNRAIANTLQILKGNLAMRVFSLSHKLFAHYVIDRTPKAGFLSLELFKMPFCRFSAATLKNRFKSVYLLSKFVYFLTRIELAVAVNGKVDNTQVNTQCSNRVVRGGLWGINCNRKIKNIIAEDKVSLLNNAIEPDFLVGTNPDWDNQSSTKSQHRNLIQPLPGKDALVVNHSRVRFEVMQFGLIPAILLNHFANYPDCHLCRQTVVFTKIIIGKMMQFYLAGSMVLKGKLGDIVASLIKPFHGLQKRIVLFWVRSEFDHQGLFHICSIEQSNPFVKGKEECVSSAT